MKTMLDLARAIDPDGRLAAIIIDAMKGRAMAFEAVPFGEIQAGETFVFIAGKDIKWEKVGDSRAQRVGTYRTRRVDPAYRVYRVTMMDESACFPRIEWVDC